MLGAQFVLETVLESNLIFPVCCCYYYSFLICKYPHLLRAGIRRDLLHISSTAKRRPVRLSCTSSTSGKKRSIRLQFLLPSLHEGRLTLLHLPGELCRVIAAAFLRKKYLRYMSSLDPAYLPSELANCKVGFNLQRFVFYSMSD
jgi:hypothetical protein